jgi:hypothetical protein
MRTILHIGMPKTGSTVLQDCLGASRDRLAAHGALYPTNPPGCPFNNHRMLIFGFMARRDLPRHVLKYPDYARGDLGARYAEFLDHVRAEVAAARPACAILSSETLFRRLGPDAGRRLAAAVAGLGGDEPPVVAVYLRRPSDYYLSALQQRLKSAHAVVPPRVQSPVAVLESYASAFGAAALRPRVYDRALFADGDVVADFLAAHLPERGIAPSALTRPAGANETVSAEAMDLMRRYRLAFHRRAEDVWTPDSAQLLRALRRIDAGVGAPRPRLREEIAEAIDYARPDPLRLRDAFGLVFPGLDYRRLERAGTRAAPGRALWPLVRALWRPWRLDEVVAIDDAVRRAILDRLARTRWAGADPARAGWVAALAREPAGALAPA